MFNKQKLIAGLCAIAMIAPATIGIGIAIPAQAEDVSPGAVQLQDAGNLQEFAQQVVELVNQERAKAGLPGLQNLAVLNTCAETRSGELVSTFSHTRPDGSNCATALNEYGVTWRTSGENIAYGYPDPESVMTGWMNSAGHRANILSENFDAIGVGVISRNGVLYWTQVFAGGVHEIQSPDQPQLPDDSQDFTQDQNQDQDQAQNPEITDWKAFLEHFVNPPQESAPDSVPDTPCIGGACPVTENPSFRDFLTGLQSQCSNGNCQIRVITPDSCESR